MATVPRVEEYRAQAQVVGAPTLSTANPVGEAAAELGATVVQATAAMGRLYARVQDEDDQRQAMEAFLGLNEDLRADMYGEGDTPGALNAAGAQALGSTQRLGERIAEVARERGKGLSSGAQAYFRERLGSWRDGVLDSAANHEQGQIEAHNQALRQAELSADASLVYRAPSNLDAAMQRAGMRAAQNKALSPALQAEQARIEQGKLAVMAATSLMDTDAEGARAILEQHRDKIDPVALEEMDRRTKAAETEQWAVTRAKELLSLGPVAALQQVYKETDPDRLQALLSTYDTLSTQMRQARDQEEKDRNDRALDVLANTGRLPSWAPAGLRIAERNARAAAADEDREDASKAALDEFRAQTLMDPDWYGRLSPDQRAAVRLQIEQQPGGWATAQRVYREAQEGKGKLDNDLFSGVARPYFEAAGVRFAPGDRGDNPKRHEQFIRATNAWQEEMARIRRVTGKEPTAEDARVAAVRLTTKVEVPWSLDGPSERVWFDLWGETDDGKPVAAMATVVPDDEEAVAARYRERATRNLQRQLQQQGRGGRPSKESIEREILRLYTDDVLARGR